MRIVEFLPLGINNTVRGVTGAECAPKPDNNLSNVFYYAKVLPPMAPLAVMVSCENTCAKPLSFYKLS